MAFKARGHLGKNSRAYTRVGYHFFEVIVGSSFDVEEEKPDTPPPSEHLYGWKPIWLKWGNARIKRANWIHLTGMTTEELEALKTVLNLGIDDALVISRDLDAKALELMDEGAAEIPYRALASAPPFMQRAIPLEYEAYVGDVASST
jgi:hypothetical protein